VPVHGITVIITGAVAGTQFSGSSRPNRLGITQFEIMAIDKIFLVESALAIIGTLFQLRSFDLIQIGKKSQPYKR
jgi:hypothetical protein